jgi:hypothetical protein
VQEGERKRGTESKRQEVKEVKCEAREMRGKRKERER